ncbi:MAG TPA: EamA family transporter, partial [Thermoanaerobaculia bacterium]|nr:EamA family transporter [Thermoanaerobaculia bacterium]
MRGKTLLLYSLCCAIWGSTWLVIKIGLADFPPLLFAGFRMGVACVLLTGFAVRGAAGLRSREARAIAVAGLLQIGVSYALVFAAEATIDSGMTAVLFASFPIWISLFAHVVLPDEPLRPATAIAAVVGMAGVALLELPAVESAVGGGRFPAAALFPLGASVASAFANVWMKKRLARVPPRVNLWGQTLVGSAFLFGLSLLLEGRARVHWTPRAAGTLAYLSVLGTVVAFLALFWLIPRVPMATIGAIPLIDTLIAMALGAIVLGERVGWRFFAGGAMILAGAAAATWGTAGASA